MENAENKKILFEKDIIIDKDKYHLTYYEDDTSQLERYNPKYKMWVVLKFSNKKMLEVNEFIKKMLSENFIRRVTMSENLT